MAITWSSALSVNVKEIDEQHKVFVGLLNEAYEVLRNPAIRDTLPELIERLVKYTKMHFGTEEKYFDTFQYEFADLHKQEHRKLEKQAELFLERVKTEGFAVEGELLDFLENWLVSHLANHDKKYTKCFNEHGLY